MTDRYKGLIVTLERDTRDDDAQPVIEAIRQIRGVLDVTPAIACGEDHMNRIRVRQSLIEKLYAVLREGGGDE